MSLREHALLQRVEVEVYHAIVARSCTLVVLVAVGVTGNLDDDIQVESVSNTPFVCDEICDFSAAAGAYVGSDQRMRIYSSWFYRNWSGRRIDFAEFAE